jgi:hypothetical protein
VVVLRAELGGWHYPEVVSHLVSDRDTTMAKDIPASQHFEQPIQHQDFSNSAPTELVGMNIR